MDMYKLYYYKLTFDFKLIKGLGYKIRDLAVKYIL
jgi:hypothetical protein